jgi:hypothetical protein
VTERDQKLQRAMHLHHELVAIREIAHRLPYDDIRRWRYSIRATEITREMAKLTAAPMLTARQAE